MAALRELNTSLLGRTVKLRNRSMRHRAWIVARLGSWSGYTSRGYRLVALLRTGGGWAILTAPVRKWARTAPGPVFPSRCD